MIYFIWHLLIVWYTSSFSHTFQPVHLDVVFLSRGESPFVSSVNDCPHTLRAPILSNPIPLLDIQRNVHDILMERNIQYWRNSLDSLHNAQSIIRQHLHRRRSTVSHLRELIYPSPTTKIRSARCRNTLTQLPCVILCSPFKMPL